MKNIFAKIKENKDIAYGIPLESKDIILCQKEIKQNNLPAIPKDMAEFMHFCNGIRYNGAIIYAFWPKGDRFLDILQQNKITTVEDCLVLGYDDFDYLTFNGKKNIYQIIDKDDLEVLEEYKEFSRALLYILKI